MKKMIEKEKYGFQLQCDNQKKHQILVMKKKIAKFKPLKLSELKRKAYICFLRKFVTFAV